MVVNKSEHFPHTFLGNPQVERPHKSYTLAHYSIPKYAKCDSISFLTAADCHYRYCHLLPFMLPPLTYIRMGDLFVYLSVLCK